ncbi:MAG: hypothetical protein WC637_02355 [Victivallales bacterium]|jgi:hypothetical protein
MNIIKILKDHIRTFHDYKSASVNIFEIFIFIVIPIVISFVLVFNFNKKLSPAHISNAITALSIFAALLFSLPILLYDVLERTLMIDAENETQEQQLADRRDLIQEINSNVSFAILSSFASVIFLFLIQISSLPEIIIQILNFITISLGIVFSLTVLFLLKRVHCLLSFDLSKLIKKKDKD